MATHPQARDCGISDDFDERDAPLLRQAVEKLVRFGQQVRALLDSGISMRELLGFLAAERSGAA